MRRIDLLIIHCTASRPNQHLSLQDLDKMHKARGWNGCGYFKTPPLEESVS